MSADGPSLDPTTERAIALYGTAEPPPERLVLHAGPMTCELEAGGLRYVRYQGVEVLRAISYLLRDANWATPAPALGEQTVDQRPDGFRVTYSAEAVCSGARFDYCAVITGTSDGTLVFEIIGQPDRDMATNRTGFCVLHPLDGVVDRPVRVTHTDGSTEATRFPRLISPSQPIFDIRSLAHEVVPGVHAVCTMEGDAFEMEDHRNWMDASFKTYIRPLSRPMPFTVGAGEEVAQRISLHFEGEPAAAPAAASGPVEVRIGAPSGTLPRIGLAIPPEEAAAALEVVEPVRALAPGLLVGQLDLRDPEAGARLQPLGALARALDVPVQLEIVLEGDQTPDTELARAANLVDAAGLEPEAVLPLAAPYLKSYQPTAVWPDLPPLEQYAEAARRAFPSAEVGGGMLSYFTEVNRKPPPGSAIDFVSHTLCPIVHDADDRTVMDNLDAVPWIAESVRALCPDVPYRVGPCAIGMRQNPYGAGVVETDGTARVAMAKRDPRQRGLFAAAWTLGLVQRLAEAGVEVATIGAATGPFGCIHTPGAMAIPWYDEVLGDAPGPYPLYHLLRSFAGLGRASLCPVQVSAPGLAALAVEAGGERRLWLANLRDQPVEVLLAGVAGITSLTEINAMRFRDLAQGFEPPPPGDWTTAEMLVLDAHATVSLGLR